MILFGILSLVAVILSLSVHEYAHGWAAARQGDPTAAREGRLTLNPLSHVDLFGTILLPLLLSVAGAPAFGYARPVPYNPAFFRDQRLGPVLVALAGPGSNFLLFFFSTGLLLLLAPLLPFGNALLVFLLIFAMTNAALGIFNILPLPPLDGAKLLLLFARDHQTKQWLWALERQGWFLLLIYIALGTPGLGWLFGKLLSVSGLLPFVLQYQALLG